MLDRGHHVFHLRINFSARHTAERDANKKAPLCLGLSLFLVFYVMCKREAGGIDQRRRAASAPDFITDYNQRPNPFPILANVM
jgi:hypothetical protein